MPQTALLKNINLNVINITVPKKHIKMSRTHINK
jgi:hypothetical protein